MLLIKRLVTTTADLRKKSHADPAILSGIILCQPNWPEVAARRRQARKISANGLAPRPIKQALARETATG